MGKRISGRNSAIQDEISRLKAQVLAMDKPAVKQFVQSAAKPQTSSKRMTTIPTAKKSVVILAFNKHIATELGDRLRQRGEFLTGSDEQEAIWNESLNGSRHMMIQAVAGSGKTTVLIQACLRLNAEAQAMTYHSLGFKACARAFGKVKVEQYKTYQILDGMGCPVAGHLEKMYKARVVKMVSLAKQYAMVDRKTLEWIVDHHDVELNGMEEMILDVVPKVLNKAKAMTSQVDFDDMIWMPRVLEMDVPKFDVVMSDECFIGDTPIMLSTAMNMPIREMVESKYGGLITSYEKGKTVWRRVVGWHKIPVRGEMVRITTQRIGFKRDGTRMSAIAEYIRFGKRNIICTKDHKFLTQNQQWLKAEELVIGTRLIQESHSKTEHGYSHKYKIGQQGKAKLSGLMRIKNDAGICGLLTGTNSGLIYGKTKRGGNGRVSPHEEAMGIRLGSDWVAQYAIPTGLWRKGGKHPTAYKVDFANTETMMALELDGSSHNSVKRQQEDIKKDKCLTDLGWTVVRLTNAEAMNMSDELLNERLANSPVECEVIAVEPWVTDEPFVYDITVDGTHCYYANGVLVHNCQDLNVIQQYLAMKAGDRHIVVGDKNQGIYGFRGADSNSMENMKRMLETTDRGVVEMPLTLTRRCPKSHVAMAQMLVPQIRAMDNAPDGKVVVMSKEQAVTAMRPGDMVLCRVNADLLMVAYRLLKRGVKAVVRGRDIGQSICRLIDKAESMADLTMQDERKGCLMVSELIRFAATLTDMEVAKFMAILNGRGEGRASAAQDKMDCLLSISEGAKDSREVRQRIESLFADFDVDGQPKHAVVLSSVHRGKGLEAGRVFVLRPDLLPHPMAKQEHEKIQELNLLYVACTRAKYGDGGVGELVFVGQLPAMFENKEIS